MVEEERPPPLARAVRRFGHPFDQIDPDGLIPQFAKAADLERRTGRFARADIQRRRPCRRRTGHRLAARRGPERKPPTGGFRPQHLRSEQHTSELQPIMSISYAVVVLKQSKDTPIRQPPLTHTLYPT